MDPPNHSGCNHYAILPRRLLGTQFLVLCVAFQLFGSFVVGCCNRAVTILEGDVQTSGGGEPIPDLHYLWFKGDTFITKKELVPYGMMCLHHTNA